jgi:hypothetical protein
MHRTPRGVAASAKYEVQWVRNYLYLWHQPESKRLISSGIEFRDFIPELTTISGLVLVRHQYDEALLDPASGFEYVQADDLPRLAADDVYGYGDFCWADIGRDVELAGLSDQAIAELAFFGHMLRPFREVEIPGLDNRFLYYGHDDGWYARIFYHEWEPLGSILRRLLPDVLPEEQALRTLEMVRRGKDAFWCCQGSVIECAQTENIDALQHQYLSDRRPAE